MPPIPATPASSDALAARLGPPAADFLPGLLARVADPDGAAQGLDRFLAAAPAVVEALRREPERLHPLLAIFSDSRFLGESLIQDPTLADWLERARHEDRPRHPEEVAADLAALAGGARGPARSLALTRFKRREYLRVVLRDSLGLASLAETTAELSHLADAVLAQAYAWAWNDGVARLGTPLHAGPERRQVTGMTVLALGKLGGGELNYSSDIDLMFVYGAAGDTAQGAANREFFLQMAQRLTAYVSEPTPEGICYRVDLRLRPGGREGEIALPLAAALAYYRGQAREWERQMLIKARVCAGSLPLGREFLAAVTPLVFPPPRAVPAAVTGARQARARMRAEQGRIGAGCDVKRDPGGIRDIEFLAQMLQRAHGGAEPWLQVGNTLQALQRLHDKGRLSGAAWQTLAGAYTLFRHVEHRLQLRFGEQTHRLPADPAALRALARGITRSQAGQRGGEEIPLSPEADAETVAALRRRLETAMAAVAALWEEPASPPAEPEGFRLRPPEPAAPHLNQGPPPGLSPRGRRHWQHWLESAQRDPDGAQAAEGLDAAAHERLAAALEASDYLAEALVLRPAEACLFAEPYDWPDERQTALLPPPPPALLNAGSPGSGAEATRQLRRAYQSAVWRQAAAEIAAPRPIAAALQRMSQRAAAAVSAALAVAQAESGAAATPLGILALGRLGLGEFDLLSDADLVFIVPAGQEPAGARIAARVIALLASYTGDGAVFPVDARLRPEGTQGELTHTDSGLQAYFAHRAGAWEAASYLKARPLAGDAALCDAAITGIRQGIGHRFAGADARVALASMRRRLERETDAGGFKSPPGGYYDADFLTAAAQLAAPESFSAGTLADRVQTLPLPATIRAELAGAVAVLRAADHAVRLLTGKPPRDLAVPAVPALPRLLAGLLQRRLHAGGPAAEISLASQTLRAVYDRVLGEAQ